MKVMFKVYGEPFGKLNMQPIRRGNYVRAVQPEKNTSYMQMVRYAYVENCCNTMFEDDEPLKVTIKAFKSIPTTFSKKKIRLIKEGQIVPITKPDCDNISKVILDSLTGLAWKDDSRVVEEHIYKYYDDIPRVEIEIESWCDQ